MSFKYAQILTDNRAIELDRLFTYIIPDRFKDSLKIGMRVLIPFGRNNRPIKGLVIDILDSYDGNFKLKEIVDVIDEESIISEELITLSKWIKDYYISSFLSSISLVLPPGDYKDVIYYFEIKDLKYNPKNLDETMLLEFIKNNKYTTLEILKEKLNINNINHIIKDLKKRDVIFTKVDIKTRISEKKIKYVKINDNISEEEINLKVKSAPKQKEIIEILKENSEGLALSDLLKLANTSNSVTNSMLKKDIILIFEEIVERKAISKHIEKYKKHILNEEQKYVYNTINDDFFMGKNNKFLIHGITGSGKTEIYLHLVEKMMKEKKQSIILVPEISLTPQTIDRFVGRFGDNVAVLHSKLSDGERFDQWKKIKNSEVSIVIGARSAIFAPFNNLGLIIIDEEHEDSYKSGQNPKYDTIEVAEKRADMNNSLLVLGTATPSINTYFKATNGNQYKVLSLTKRAANAILPDVEIVDMRLELEKGNKSIYSENLYNEMVRALDNKKQIILFLNRRGFSTFVSCRECGYVVQCDKCDISMTYHRNINKLRCHYCGETKEIPRTCPECGSKYIKYFGIGTQKVEEITKAQFPNARVARLDADTTQAKNAYENILSKMKNKEIDILVGTQMIAKGLDFEDVSLVGIIAADTSLNIPNYNSSEKTFQLVTQVSGRAGRGDYPGKVILQTYEPDHYSLQYAKEHDFLGFYEDEIEVRNMQLYPPFIKFINIIISGEDINKVINNSTKIYNILGSEIYHIYKDDFYKYIIGPSPAPLERIKNRYRYQIIVKVEDLHFEQIKNILDRMIFENRFNLDFQSISLNIEINPSNIL